MSVLILMGDKKTDSRVRPRQDRPTDNWVPPSPREKPGRVVKGDGTWEGI